MRKFTLSLAVVFLVSMLLFAGCKKTPGEMAPPIPSDVIFYTSIVNLDATWNGIRATQLSQEIKKLDIWSDPNVQQAFEKIKTALAEAEKDIGLPINNETIMAVFGKRIDISISPGTPLPQVVLAADLGVKTTAVKIIDYIQKEYSKGDVQTEKYKKIDMTLIPVAEGSPSPVSYLAYFFSGNYLVFTSDPSVARRCIDIISGDATSLFDSEMYASAKPLIADYGNKAFLDSAALIRTVAAFDKDTSVKVSDTLKEIDRISGGWNWTPEGFTGASFVDYNQNQTFTHVFGAPADTNKSLSFVPDESMLVSAGAVNLQKMLEYQKAKLLQGGDEEVADMVTQGLTMANEVLGVNIEDELKAWVDSGTFFNIQNINSQGMFPMPETVIGLHVKDEAKAKAFMNRIEGILTAQFEEKHLQFSELEVEGVLFRFIPLPLGPNVAPGYAVSDGYLLIASSQAGFTEAMKASQGNRGKLVDSAGFKAAGYPDPSQLLGIQYMNTAQFFQTLGDLVNNYRMFFPETINPDHVRNSLLAMGNITGYHSDIQLDGNRLSAKMRLNIK